MNAGLLDMLHDAGHNTPLSICYRIAEEHGGSIHYEPVPEGGASFVVEIPPAPSKS